MKSCLFQSFLGGRWKDAVNSRCIAKCRVSYFAHEAEYIPPRIGIWGLFERQVTSKEARDGQQGFSPGTGPLGYKVVGRELFNSARNVWIYMYVYIFDTSLSK